MKKLLYLFLFAFICFIISYSTGFSWGFYAHKRIDRMAVFTLPPQMIGLYKKHIDFITAHAVDPDKRRYSDPKEAPRHYIDIDHYGKHPFDSVPFRWIDAVHKYSEDTLDAYGIVPWYIVLEEKRLTYAFKEKNLDRILDISAEIGHYIADAHVPLHTTENYDGQYTNQRGIHGLWESSIPELLANNYDYFVGRAVYIKHLQKKAWSIVRASNSEVDSVLTLEAKLSKTFPTDKKYSYVQKGKRTVKTYSPEYVRAYSKVLNGMVERRLRASIIDVGSYWYTAWVNAGQPNLDDMENKNVSDSLDTYLKKSEQIWMHGKIKDFKK